MRNVLPQSSPPGFPVQAAKGGNSETKNLLTSNIYIKHVLWGGKRGERLAFRILYDTVNKKP
jgi:hypothetical protein